MKELILKGNNAALKVSQLQQRLDESQKNDQSLVMLINSRHRNRINSAISKKEAYIMFYGTHSKSKAVQKMHEELREQCAKAGEEG